MNSSSGEAVSNAQYRCLVDRCHAPLPASSLMVYRVFTRDKGRSEREIATLLNEERQLTDLGRKWTRATVHQVLTNEKYVGNNVYNRTSFKLKAKRITNPPDMWVRANGVFPSLIDAVAFEAVQRIIHARSRRFTDDEMPLDCPRCSVTTVGSRD